MGSCGCLASQQVILISNVAQAFINHADFGHMLVQDAYLLIFRDRKGLTLRGLALPKQQTDREVRLKVIKSKITCHEPETEKDKETDKSFAQLPQCPFQPSPLA